MPIFGIELSEISLTQIEDLLYEQEREDLYLDYKEELPNFADERQKLKFLHDISALANESGGDMVFGVSEKRDAENHPTGIPETVEGLSVPNKQTVQLKMEQIALTGLNPPLRGIRFRWIDTEKGRTVLVLRIPKSWVGPHATISGSDIRVYRRTSMGKRPLQFQEIRDMVIGSATIIDKIRQFRLQRVEMLRRGDLPIQDKPSVVMLHMIPFDALEKGNLYPAELLKEKKSKRGCLPLGSTGYLKSRFNFDGVLDLDGKSLENLNSYLQIFRNGIVESANNCMVFGYEGKLAFNSTDLETNLIFAFRRYCTFQGFLQIQLPVFTFITLTNVRNVIILSNYIREGDSPEPIDRDHLLIPEIIVKSFDGDPATILRPAFDAIWNAADMPKSLSYDEKGKYDPD